MWQGLPVSSVVHSEKIFNGSEMVEAFGWLSVGWSLGCVAGYFFGLRGISGALKEAAAAVGVSGNAGKYPPPVDLPLLGDGYFGPSGH